MIERYTRPKMGAIWTQENRFAKWLEVEIAALEAWAEIEVVPREALDEIKNKAKFDVERIDEIEREVNHDVIAFLTNLAENIGPASRYVHYGLTSSDVVDTGLSLQMKEAVGLLMEEVKSLVGLLKRRAFEFKDLVMTGRTHGVHAEPFVFGLKLANWAFEMARNYERLTRAREAVSVGKLSGAVGTYSNVEPAIEARVCEMVGLRPAPVSSQVIQRDRHAEYMSALAICAATIEKMAVEIRSLQRTDILEAEEPFTGGQKGSSAMPHKRNPITCERLTGLARIMRSNAQAAFENVALWGERDISHSSVERVIVPDSSILLDYMLSKISWVIEGLNVYPGNMRRNLERMGGIVFSSRLLLALVEKGITREEAYRLVQRNAMKAWQGGEGFRDLVSGDPEIAALLTQDEISKCFDERYYLRNVGVVFERLEGLTV